MCLLLVAIVGCTDDSEDVTCESRIVRVDAITMPNRAAPARTLALDLNGDKTGDNVAGTASAYLHQEIPALDLAASANARLTSDVVWLLEVSECSDGAAHVSVGESAALDGTLVDGRIVAHGKTGEMPISTLWDPYGTFPAAGFLRATTAAIDMQRFDDGHWEGRIGMGFVSTELIDAVVGPMVPYLDEHHLFMSYLDYAPEDGHLTPEEVKNANVVKNAMFPSDLAKRDTSFAIGFSAR